MTFICEKLNYEPNIIDSGREINDSMANYAANIFFNLLNKRLKSHNYKILIIGITFKENCNDIRNSKVFDLIDGLKNLGCIVDITDQNIQNQFNLDKDIKFSNEPPKKIIMMELF